MEAALPENDPGISAKPDMDTAALAVSVQAPRHTRTPSIDPLASIAPVKVARTRRSDAEPLSPAPLIVCRLLTCYQSMVNTPALAAKLSTSPGARVLGLVRAA